MVPDVATLIKAARLRYFRRLYTTAPTQLQDLLVSEDSHSSTSWFEALRDDLRWLRSLQLAAATNGRAESAELWRSILGFKLPSTSGSGMESIRKN